MDGWGGYLVRDDYAGWHQYDATLAGVGQCGAHLIRHLQGVLDLHPAQQAWAGEVQQILREANNAVTAANTAGATHLDPALLHDLRERYNDRVKWGIITNRHPLLPGPFLPDQRPKPRRTPHRRHPPSPHRTPLDTTDPRIITDSTREWTLLSCMHHHSTSCIRHLFVSPW